MGVTYLGIFNLSYKHFDVMREIDCDIWELYAFFNKNVYILNYQLGLNCPALTYQLTFCFPVSLCAVTTNAALKASTAPSLIAIFGS